MVMTMGKQPFCAHARLVISVVHVLTVKDAPPQKCTNNAVMSNEVISFREATMGACSNKDYWSMAKEDDKGQGKGKGKDGKGAKKDHRRPLEAKTS